MQKGIRAEDGEHKSEQDAGNDGGDFHVVMITGFGDFSTLFQSTKPADYSFSRFTSTRSMRSLRTATI